MTQAPESPHPEVPQPSLFDSIAPAVVLTPAQRAELAAIVEVLLREIAAALAGTTAEESGHE
jgi:DNA-binding MarR family transcriptional regulator